MMERPGCELISIIFYKISASTLSSDDGLLWVCLHKSNLRTPLIKSILSAYTEAPPKSTIGPSIDKEVLYLKRRAGISKQRLAMCSEAVDINLPGSTASLLIMMA